MTGASPEGTLWITGEPEVDGLVNRDPLALLIGMLLDQQITIETAFRGPSRLRDRLDGPFTADTIANYEPEAFLALCRIKPSLHRFPGSMAGGIQALAQSLVDEYDGEPQRLWTAPDRSAPGSPPDASTVLARLESLPGFGPEKSRIFLAVLGKRFGVDPSGWEAAAAPFSDDQPRSVADMGSPEGHAAVRAWKKAQKAAGRTKSD